MATKPVPPKTATKDWISDLASIDPKVSTLESELVSDTAHVYSFDCPPIDITYGGIKSGRIYELFGWESAGKSTIALEGTKAFKRYWQEKDPTAKTAVFWVETESAFDRARAKHMGCDVDDFLVFPAETVEDAHEIIKKALTKAIANKIKLYIVWDTIAAASTRNEKEKGTYAGGMVEKPRLIRQMFRDITTPLGATDSVLFIVNQMYTGIGMFAKDESPGGGGLKFHCSVRTCITKKEAITNGDPLNPRQIGIVSELKHIKNKTTLPNQTCSIYINGETGLDRFRTVFHFVRAQKVIETKGSWSYISIPDRAYNPDKKDEAGNVIMPEMKDISFQSDAKLKEIFETQYPHGFDYLNYLIYKHYTTVSPLVKVNIIKKVWHYETIFFGSKQTVLTPHEIEVAKVVYSQLDDKETLDEM